MPLLAPNFTSLERKWQRGCWRGQDQPALLHFPAENLNHTSCWTSQVCVKSCRAVLEKSLLKTKKSPLVLKGVSPGSRKPVRGLGGEKINKRRRMGRPARWKQKCLVCLVADFQAQIYSKGNLLRGKTQHSADLCSTRAQLTPRRGKRRSKEKIKGSSFPL